MNSIEDRPHRRNIRLSGYDYSLPGAYFVTIVTQKRKPLFGHIANGEMILNEVGRMVQAVWLEIPNYFANINVDTLVIMPNHLHGIIEINASEEVVRVVPDTDPKKNTQPSTRPQNDAQIIKEVALSAIINHYKSFTTNQYIVGVRLKGWDPFERHVWQRNYYEHIIRDDRDLQKVFDYIQANPLNWADDEEFTG